MAQNALNILVAAAPIDNNCPNVIILNPTGLREFKFWGHALIDKEI